MPHTRERAVAGVMSGRMTLDDHVTWEAHHLGRTWRMTSRISAYQRPTRVVDEIVDGPSPSFRHEHIFEFRHDLTRMTDRLEYRLPLGLIGVLGDALVLRLYMRSLLAARNRYIKALAEAGDSDSRV